MISLHPYTELRMLRKLLRTGDWRWAQETFSIHPALCAHEADVRRDKLLEPAGGVGLLSTAAP